MILIGEKADQKIGFVQFQSPLRPLTSFSNIDFNFLVPARTTGQVLLGQVDIDVQEDAENELTTEESLPKKCIVDDNAYSHGQTVRKQTYLRSISLPFAFCTSAN